MKIDFETLRYMEGRRTRLEAQEIWRMPEWEWCDQVVADPSLLSDVPEHLQVDIRMVTAEDLNRLTRTQLADLAHSWDLPRSGTRARLITELLTAGALLRRLDGETEESLARLTVRQLNEMLRTARLGLYGNKATRVRQLLGWRDATQKKRLVYLARLVYARELQKARARGETIPVHQSNLEPILAEIRARRVSPGELERRIKALNRGIQTSPGDVVTLADQPEALRGLTYVVEGETSQGLITLRCRERPRWPAIQVHRCYLRTAPA